MGPLGLISSFGPENIILNTAFHWRSPPIDEWVIPIQPLIHHKIACQTSEHDGVPFAFSGGSGHGVPRIAG